MEKAGLISRHAHERDRRARRVRIEAKGEKVFATALDLAKSLQAQILETLPASRRESFLRDLEKVADACADAHGGDVGVDISPGA
jgi:DNA-binding MarR family transcriptional regulator